MRVSDIAWDDDSILYIRRHGVESEEVEAVCFKGSALTLKTRLNRYITFGQTEGRRYLTIVFEYLGNNRAKIITARAMSKQEHKIYKRR